MQRVWCPACLQLYDQPNLPRARDARSNVDLAEPDLQRPSGLARSTRSSRAAHPDPQHAALAYSTIGHARSTRSHALLADAYP